ncbi:hypothetical protein D0B54_04030 [Solimonas sp. K1W22B-7]|uniref:hypothetical protein n=1 Tax=Solimonas sp. K1W22B-7 TaxID=2303331 RepID=UPI000E336071|nr:hypothetical protein [Solimonas sp. K1W22B-7]AXQ27894.1 hypothetical protein D0B54_04030 [Solimonas sp. K1W22B-7]
MNEHLLSIFRQPDALAARGKYLSRIFGIFSEEVVRIWAKDRRCPFEDHGRPTLRSTGKTRGCTLDFTLRHKSTDLTYVAELKCEIEFQNYKYFILSDAAQLSHHRKEAFRAFLEAAIQPSAQQIFVRGKAQQINGAILIWGAATPEGRKSAIETYGFHDVLTISEIVHDLRSWNHDAYEHFLEQRRSWSNELFDGLLAAL